jgi:outer membrane protein assembly factor BamD (BamD/ComL family)
MRCGFCRRAFLTSLLLTAAGWLHPVQATAARPYFEQEPEPTRLLFFGPARDNPAAQLRHADELREQAKLGRATRQYRSLVNAWPNSSPAATAQWRLAQTLRLRNKLDLAFENYQTLLDQYAGQVPHDTVLAELYELAQTMQTRRRGDWLFLPGWLDPEAALPIYETIVTHGPRWPNTPNALLAMAEIQAAADNWQEAVTHYERLIHDFPDHPLAETAAFGRADSLTRWSANYPTHIDGMQAAIQAISVSLRDYPDAPQAALAREQMLELRERIATLEYEAARYYDAIAKEPTAAITAYEQFLAKHPNSTWTATVRDRLQALKSESETGESDDQAQP